MVYIWSQCCLYYSIWREEYISDYTTNNGYIKKNTTCIELVDSNNILTCWFNCCGNSIPTFIFFYCCPWRIYAGGHTTPCTSPLQQLTWHYPSSTTPASLCLSLTLSVCVWHLTPYSQPTLSLTKLGDQLEKEHPSVTTTGGISGGRAQLMQTVGCSVKTQTDSPTTGTSQTVARCNCYDIDRHAGGVHGSSPSSSAGCWDCCRCDACRGGPPSYHEAQAPLGDISPLNTGRPPILGVPTASVTGNTSWTSDLPHHRVYGHVPDRVGRDLHGESNRWSAASKREPTYQPPWIPGPAFGPSTFEAPGTGEKCYCELTTVPYINFLH